MKGTVREARKQGWLPGTTSVLKMWPSPGLNIYFREQDIMAAGTTPRLSIETDKEWKAKVIRSAAEHAANSRVFGSDWAECQAQGVCIHEYLRPWWDLALPENEVVIGREQVVVNMRYGYAGRLDRLSRFGEDETIWLSDDKCRENPRVYDTDVMQLSAYLDCLPMEQWVRTKCRSRIINRLTPEPPMVREWSIEEVRQGFEKFLCCLRMFRLFHNL